MSASDRSVAAPTMTGIARWPGWSIRCSTAGAPRAGTVYPSVATTAATWRAPITVGIVIMSSMSKSVSIRTQLLAEGPGAGACAVAGTAAKNPPAANTPAGNTAAANTAAENTPAENTGPQHTGPRNSEAAVANATAARRVN